ncbi:type VI immunity family protein [Mesorhizobium sp. M0488]|uniref:type VI immunity family protein n=1 Tax=unclassified Mesorhizobium TaxID=325217 RepID=UPI0033359B74
MSETLLDLQRKIADNLVRIAFEVTVYPWRVTVPNFERIVRIFLAFCPPEQLKFFRISELPVWSRLSEPALTRSGHEAQVDGTPMPFFEPVRKRIREDRAFVARLWDGREIDDPLGSWSLTIVREKYAGEGLFSYARVLVPLESDPNVLVALARQFAEDIELLSGHGGPVFGFNPVLPYAAFTKIYTHSRRYLGIDIDMLDMCPRHMKHRLKSPCWINLIGHELTSTNDLPLSRGASFQESGIRSNRQRFADVHVIGNRPVPLDVNRQAEGASGYRAYGEAISDFVLSEADTGPLDGEGFFNNPGTTDDWLHRFGRASAWVPDGIFKTG